MGGSASKENCLKTNSELIEKTSCPKPQYAKENCLETNSELIEKTSCPKPQYTKEKCLETSSDLIEKTSCPKSQKTMNISEMRRILNENVTPGSGPLINALLNVLNNQPIAFDFEEIKEDYEKFVEMFTNPDVGNEPPEFILKSVYFENMKKFLLDNPEMVHLDTFPIIEFLSVQIEYMNFITSPATQDKLAQNRPIETFVNKSKSFANSNNLFLILVISLLIIYMFKQRMKIIKGFKKILII